jgi:hypothetical protein
MKYDKQALNRIQELEQSLEDAHVIIDLQREELWEKEEMIASLKGQLQNLRIDRRYEVG